ncbi:MAG: hypothetical protein MJE63_05905 [Proteobacteria bacterium]|nr:hypothetical protein [Pseudomonadota bacterium]
MSGIISYGIHVPRWRLSKECINQAWSRPGGKGERSVANFDEDSITMGVSSGLACLKNAGVKEENLSGLYFASTTPPYREKSAAAVISTALDLCPEIRTADYGASLRASSSALFGAIDYATSRKEQNIMVTGSDCRLAEPGSLLEPVLGDAAASVLVGNRNVVADIVDTYSVCNDIFDLWRRSEDSYIRQDDVRFSQIYGFQKSVSEAITGILKKTGLTPVEYTKIMICQVDSRTHAKVASKLGFDIKTQLLSLPNDIGLCGTALPLVMIAVALDQAAPGD